ncbi:MAG: helix-turn-helix domain-containing protein [Muribaculaceae bacterium]|nr:helix-turn-helix domain-containing protein [Muribaculaceae bacterium]
MKACAGHLCMSPNYFSDVVKRLIGENAGQYIREFVVQKAKAGMLAGKTIAEVAYGLGFEYPQHLTRMFRAHTGMSPTGYLASVRGK